MEQDCLDLSLGMIALKVGQHQVKFSIPFWPGLMTIFPGRYLLPFISVWGRIETAGSLCQNAQTRHPEIRCQQVCPETLSIRLCIKMFTSRVKVCLPARM